MKGGGRIRCTTRSPSAPDGGYETVNPKHKPSTNHPKHEPQSKNESHNQPQIRLIGTARMHVCICCILHADCVQRRSLPAGVKTCHMSMGGACTGSRPRRRGPARHNCEGGHTEGSQCATPGGTSGEGGPAGGTTEGQDNTELIEES